MVQAEHRGSHLSLLGTSFLSCCITVQLSTSFVAQMFFKENGFFFFCLQTVCKDAAIFSKISATEDYPSPQFDGKLSVIHVGNKWHDTK